MKWALFFLVLTGCTVSEQKSIEILRTQGFSSIELDGFVPFACSDSDSFVQGFRAKNAQGLPVNGVLCCGFFKGCTVRF